MVLGSIPVSLGVQSCVVPDSLGTRYPRGGEPLHRTPGCSRRTKLLDSQSDSQVPTLCRTCVDIAGRGIRLRLEDGRRWTTAHSLNRIPKPGVAGSNPAEGATQSRRQARVGFHLEP